MFFDVAGLQVDSVATPAAVIVHDIKASGIHFFVQVSRTLHLGLDAHKRLERSE